MSECTNCELCGMMIMDDPVVRVVQGSEHCFDTEDCALLYERAAKAGML